MDIDATLGAGGRQRPRWGPQGFANARLVIEQLLDGIWGTPLSIMRVATVCRKRCGVTRDQTTVVVAQIEHPHPVAQAHCEGGVGVARLPFLPLARELVVK